MTIKIFITGGTIDDLDYGSEDKKPNNPKTQIPKLLKKARLSENCDAEVLFMKDSKFVTDYDRKIILKNCKNCRENKIIITHGTMTMPVTAKFLGKSKIKKTIVLTGSFIAAANANSDAFFNLGFAFAAVQFLPKGVYVAMNGKIFSWDNVKKNLKTGFFEEQKQLNNQI